jgi:protein-S-isoprenylcysteine O-methyltransferase Ste14
MSGATVLKLAARAIVTVLVLQVFFFFVFQAIGYDSYLLSVTLVISVIIGVLLLIGWRNLQKAVK